MRYLGNEISRNLAGFGAGLRAELPLVIGVIPFGMIYGVLALSSGLQPVEAQAMSAVVFAGSSQFIATQLLGTGAPGWVILLTVAMVNLRHALYSASLAPYLKRLHPAWKWLLAYLLTDEAYAVTITYYDRCADEQTDPAKCAHWFFLGAGIALWTAWQVSTAVGIFLGASVPASWALDFTLALTFIAIVVPALKDRPMFAAALVAGVTALAANGLPYKLGLVLAALLGILAGAGLEERK
jgi:4-azaleucine resistance transporter AzlC